MAQVFALRVDCADARSVREAFEGVLSLGPVEVLVYNACEPPADRPTPFLAVSPDAFHRALAVSAVGAFHCAQQVIPGMVERGRGTIIFTGSSASVTGFGGYADLSKC
jgi:NAD(P)-dependent dehydrogenase (short-subunit alcohol dehydrogenase family)